MLKNHIFLLASLFLSHFAINSSFAQELPAMQFSQSQIQSLVTKFAPELRLHVDEKYFPSSVDYYLKGVALKDTNDKILIPRGQVTSQALAQYNFMKYGTDASKSGFYLEADDSVKQGIKPVNNMVHVPVYANFIPTSNGAIIQYLFFDPFNGPFQIGELPLRVDKLVNPFTSGRDVGDHWADWEHINVNLEGTSPDNLQIKDVYFARHSPYQDGSFAKPKLVAGTHPVVYRSKWGHAAHERYKDRQDDQDATSNNGPKWQTWENAIYVGTKERPTPGNEWLQFVGFWGQTRSKNPVAQIFGVATESKDIDSPPSPIAQPWWRNAAYQTMPGLNENPKARVSVNVVAQPEQKNVHQNNTIVQSSPDFGFDGNLPTYIRHLIWEIKSTTPSNDVIYNVYDTSDKLVFADLRGPKAITPKPDLGKKYYIGNVRLGSGRTSDAFTIEVRGLFDGLSLKQLSTQEAQIEAKVKTLMNAGRDYETALGIATGKVDETTLLPKGYKLVAQPGWYKDPSDPNSQPTVYQAGDKVKSNFVRINPTTGQQEAESGKSPLDELKDLINEAKKSFAGGGGDMFGTLNRLKNAQVLAKYIVSLGANPMVSTLLTDINTTVQHLETATKATTANEISNARERAVQAFNKVNI